MSVDIYSTESRLLNGPVPFAAVLKEAVAILLRYAPITITDVIEDTEENYQVEFTDPEQNLIRLGVYHSAGANYSTYVCTITTPSGAIHDGFPNTSGRQTYTSPYYGRAYVYVVNGGDFWQLRVPIYRSGSVTGFCLRGAKLISSIEGILWTLSTPAFIWGSGTGFPAVDYITVDDLVQLRYAKPVNAQYNIPQNQLLLYPSLLAASVGTSMGVPTIGNQQIYTFSGNDASDIGVLQEFIVNRQRFVNLGDVCIRSV